MVLNIMEIMRNGRIIRTDVFSLKLYLKIMCVCVCVCGGCIACKQNKLKKIVPKPEYQFLMCTYAYHYKSKYCYFKKPICSSVSKEFACSAGDPGLISELGRSLDKEMATNSSILDWKIPWTEEPGGLQSMGSQSRAWLNK